MDLNNLKGIGEKTEKLFYKAGIEKVNDLLRYYPRWCFWRASFNKRFGMWQNSGN